ncbi:MAG: hypothetical protein ACJAWS_002085, partial [Oleiphilaceae bacterium]
KTVEETKLQDRIVIVNVDILTNSGEFLSIGLAFSNFVLFLVRHNHHATVKKLGQGRHLTYINIL